MKCLKQVRDKRVLLGEAGNLNVSLLSSVTFRRKSLNLKYGFEKLKLRVFQMTGIRYNLVLDTNCVSFVTITCKEADFLILYQK